MMLFKKFIFSILILLFVITSCTAYASMPIKNAIDKQTINFSAEKDAILNAQINSKMKPKDLIFDNQKNNRILKQNNKDIKNKDDIVYGNIFKEYNLVPPIKDAADLYNQILNSSYSWKFPIYLNDTDNSKLPISTALIDKTKDENYWHLVLVNTNSTPEICDIISNSNKLAEILNNTGINSVENLLIFKLLEQDFVYVSTNGNNYIIPLFSYGDSWFGMKTKTKYTINEFTDNITSYINSLQPVTGGLPKSANPTQEKSNYSVNYIYYISGILLITIIILFLFNNKKLIKKLFNHNL